jgi:hypothetical protein
MDTGALSAPEIVDEWDSTSAGDTSRLSESVQIYSSLMYALDAILAALRTLPTARESLLLGVQGRPTTRVPFTPPSIRISRKNGPRAALTGSVGTLVLPSHQAL